MRSPRDFLRPLAVGAPEPLRVLPVAPTRVIHFFDPSDERMVAKLPELATRCDVVLGNLEDAIPAATKGRAREALIRIANHVDLGGTPLWVRVNALESPWILGDLTELVMHAGRHIAVVMVPKVESAADIHYVDRLLAQLEARARLPVPILVHAILETALGVTNVEEIAVASPRIQGMSLGPVDLAASRRMKTMRAGGPHPDYRTIEEPNAADASATRASAIQDLWHYTIARMVDACVAGGILPFYGPFGDLADPVGCEVQFRAAYVLGCVGGWSLHPSQIDIAKRAFTPSVEDVRFAGSVLDAMPDGHGMRVLDGKMHDDATWKQCEGVMSVARMLAAKDPELAELYGFSSSHEADAASR